MKAESGSLSKRSERTKSDLKRAYISLINEKGYSHVSITDIVKRSDYNRTTFYLHYLDKPDITEELRQEMFDGVKNTSMDRYEEDRVIQVEQMGPYSFELMNYIFMNQEFFNLYIKDDTIPGLNQDMPRAIYEILEERFILTAVESTTINTTAHKRYMAHGTAGLILEWIRSGYYPSPNDMTIQLIEILKSFAKEFRIVRSEYK
ncbi:TetR/AcrR family transcriptional regulator [Radiobacillus sp. PE A8.2]|uniref:TetR/AcrR family transcriptional regulator n=1 Tax=Radiobacillus sp. PE A8.2 TaxID=3380349 RepID=UPI00388EF625